MRELCRLSKNMYNVALYNVRQYFFAERKRLPYESNYHLSKENENYKLLNTDIAQQTMKVVDRSFKSFTKLLPALKTGMYNQVQLPRYLPKDGYFVLILPRIDVKEDGYFKVPMSKAFASQFGTIRLQLPRRLKDKEIKEVRIHPKYKARFFEIEYVYKQEPQPTKVDPTIALAIDFGVNNLATCVSSAGASFIVDGKPLKALNQWYNKQNAYLQSKKDIQGIKGITLRQARLLINRNNSVRDYLNKTARYIIDYCITVGCGKLIVGYNPGIKQDVNMGGRNNQNFVQIPHYSLRQKLEGLCKRYAIEFVEQEESYTSRASFLDDDDIPIYNADNPQKYKFSGRRIKRGLYRSKSGRVISADVNAAGNILKKSKHDLDLQRVCSGLLTSPLRILIS